MGREKPMELRPLTAEEQAYFRSLCIQHHDELVNYAFAITGDAHLAEEAVQETFLDVCRKPKRLMEAPHPLRWLKKACSLNYFELRRNERAYRERNRCIDDPAVIPRLPHETEPELEWQTVALDLPKEDVELLTRAYLDEEPRETLAAEYGLTTDTLNKRISRLRIKLKKYLK